VGAADPRDHHRVEGGGSRRGLVPTLEPQFFVKRKEIMFLGFSGAHESDHRVGSKHVRSYISGTVRASETISMPYDAEF